MTQKNIKLLRTINGEDIIAEVLYVREETISIKNAVVVVRMPQQPGQKGISVGFAPWMEFTDDLEFTIDRSYVIAILTPIKMLVSQHSQMFSGIITPSGSGLLLPQ